MVNLSNMEITLGLLKFLHNFQLTFLSELFDTKNVFNKIKNNTFD